jgi:hypothetical protein
MSNLAVPTSLATRTYSVVQEQHTIGNDVLNLGMINFKARIHNVNGRHILISNDSDYINRKQLAALDNVLTSREAKNVSLIRALEIDGVNVVRGFAVPTQLTVEKEDKTTETIEGRKVLVWNANENPLKDIKPADYFLDDYVWVTASIFPFQGQLTIKAAFAPCFERTRAKDAVIEKPKRLSLAPTSETVGTSKTK